jgi:hypothetical protein
MNVTPDRVQETKAMSRKESPDFFIIGAPKCGTTALAAYLSRHRDVKFSKSKEPNFFSRDIEFCRWLGTYEEYMEEYFPGDHEGLLLGEGSPFYLYSEAAVPGILEKNPEARFLVTLRNPVAQVVSMHAQRLLNSDEDVEDFGAAWRLQSERREGSHIPKRCRDPKILMYRDIANYPVQLERLFRHTDRDQVKVILFDDFSADTAGVYEEVLRFLGLESDGQQRFEKIHERKANRSTFIARILRNPPPALLKMAESIKRMTGLERLGVLGRLKALNTDFSPTQPPLSDEVVEELRSVFRADTLALQEMLDRDLSDWL